MTAAGHGDGGGWEPPAATPVPDDYAAAIGALDDPLTDPLPGSYGTGRGTPPPARTDGAAPGPAAGDGAPPAAGAGPAPGSGRRRRPGGPADAQPSVSGPPSPAAEQGARTARHAGQGDARAPWQGPGTPYDDAPPSSRPGGAPGDGPHGAARPGADAPAVPGRRTAGPSVSGYAEPVFPSAPSPAASGHDGPAGAVPGTPGGHDAAAHRPAQGSRTDHRADPATVGLRPFPDSAAPPAGSGRRRRAPSPVPPAPVPGGAEDATAVIEAIPAAPPVGGPDGAGGPVVAGPPGTTDAATDATRAATVSHDTADAVDGRDDDGPDATAPAPATSGPVPGGRLARRQAERERKTTRANKIANVFGEVMITTGVLMMLFVTYQLWWTNVEARAHANSQVDALLDQWDSGGGGSGDNAADSDREESGGDEEDDGEVDTSPGVFSPGDGFALLHLPTIGVRVPIAEGVDPASVLDRGMVGRYSAEDGLPTAMPWDAEGNMGLAAHRNTHGEPFRYINRINPGEPIVVETESTYYVYEMRSRLDSTSPAHIQVLDPVPDASGFSGPGRYITLTTCTPEFTSTYRLIVWGEMVSEQPRADGKPDALLN
ncbi:class E sortase [Streptomyces bohaiensis]|uniref:class E sortase n=1 Tax=Streptomyces bohaiensis TaxID=1431344 RepID=UPI0030C781BA